MGYGTYHRHIRAGGFCLCQSFRLFASEYRIGKGPAVVDLLRAFANAYLADLCNHHQHPFGPIPVFQLLPQKSMD